MLLLVGVAQDPLVCITQHEHLFHTKDYQKQANKAQRVTETENVERVHSIVMSPSGLNFNLSVITKRNIIYVSILIDKGYLKVAGSHLIIVMIHKQ